MAPTGMGFVWPFPVVENKALDTTTQAVVIYLTAERTNCNG